MYMVVPVSVKEMIEHLLQTWFILVSVNKREQEFL